jgi:hypothetical protein
MGVASSPDLANLYGAHYENDIVAANSSFLFFGRFIDDVLAAIAAESEADALRIANTVQYGPCKIDYSVSEWNTPFLDLFVFIDPATNQIGHKPFRKARNNLERIPWASHHPKDVKKGTFIGEMSRLATLCSQPQYYIEALKELALLYVARGYPEDLVNSWLREYSALRWRNRLNSGNARPDEEVFVLKSRFNPVWSMLDTHELGRTVTNAWGEYLDRLMRIDPLAHESSTPEPGVIPPEEEGDGRPGARPLVLVPRHLRRGHIELKETLDVRRAGFCDRRWLVSRRRNINLFDLVASWKKSVLSINEQGDLPADDMEWN